MASTIQATKGELPQEIQSEIDAAKLQFGEMLVTQEQAVRRIGNALQKVMADKPDRICATIKFVLKEYIEQGAITERRIEQICPAEWKNAARAEAGAQGAEKISAKAKKKIAVGPNGAMEEDGGDSTALKEKVDVMSKQINDMQLRMDSFMPAFQAVVDQAIVEDDYVKIPKQAWSELIKVAPGN